MDNRPMCEYVRYHTNLYPPDVERMVWSVDRCVKELNIYISTEECRPIVDYLLTKDKKRRVELKEDRRRTNPQTH